MKLKKGLHLILAANNKGGASKSTACAEMRVACKLEGIPCQLVTLDGSSETLNDIFPKERVFALAKSNGDILLATLGPHMDEARANGELIIADMPPGITDADHPVLKAFKQSKILEEFDSIGLLVPVTTHKDHIKGALDVLAAFKDVPVNYDRGMIRAWRPKPTSPSWDSFASWTTLEEKFPVWECASFAQSFSDMMQGQQHFKDYTALDELPEFFNKVGPTMSACDRDELSAAILHLDAARQYIRTHLLEPICENELVKA